MDPKIVAFVNKQKEFNDRQAVAIDSTVASSNGVTGDIEALNKKIVELQNSGGGITPEDQALLDAVQAHGEALATKGEALAVALKALDDQTPPVVPPTT